MDAFEPMVIAAKNAGIKRFIYASSSSVYGVSEEENVKEDHPLVPLTLYNKYKGLCEPLLRKHCDDIFTGVTFRPATVCGYSPRQRLDLVVNILSNLAYHKREISVFGGDQLRPNIHIKDMARAIDWACIRQKSNGGEFLAINVGSDSWNYQVKDLAYAVKEVIGDVNISINQNALPDKRSYKVDFSLFKKLAGSYHPKVGLYDAVKGLYEGLKIMDFNNLHNIITSSACHVLLVL